MDPKRPLKEPKGLLLLQVFRRSSVLAPLERDRRLKERATSEHLHAGPLLRSKCPCLRPVNALLLHVCYSVWCMRLPGCDVCVCSVTPINWNLYLHAGEEDRLPTADIVIEQASSIPFSSL